MALLSLWITGVNRLVVCSVADFFDSKFDTTNLKDVSLLYLIVLHSPSRVSTMLVRQLTNDSRFTYDFFIKVLQGPDHQVHRFLSHLLGLSVSLLAICLLAVCFFGGCCICEVVCMVNISGAFEVESVVAIDNL